MYQYIDIKTASEDLKNHISRFEPFSLLTHLYYLFNSHTRTSHSVLKLESPLMQIQYLTALYLSTGAQGKEVFDPISGKFKYIQELLEKIEYGYRYNFLNEFPTVTFDDFPRNLEVSNTTFINYFVNGTLNYVEQELERLTETFQPYNDYIQQHTGLSINDYMDFYEVTAHIDIHRFNIMRHTMEEIEHTDCFQKSARNRQIPEFEKVVDAVEQAIYGLAIPYEDLTFFFPKVKVDQWLKIFTCSEVNPAFLYYTDANPLTSKPLIKVREGYYLFISHNLLTQAMYRYLKSICFNIDGMGKRINNRKDKQLEEKTKRLFKTFFGECKVYENYYLKDLQNEKDLLVLYRNSAFIIECKAHGYNEPLRDVDKAFVRIKSDFTKCIQYGYDQAREVETEFKKKGPLEIFSKKRELVDVINTNRYTSVYCIVVTLSRFGNIQCDLSLLLEKPEPASYPWSVYVDDLETFLITLKRKDNFYGEFITYLTARQKLHGRMNAFDELDICAHYLEKKDFFIKGCNSSHYYVPSPTSQRLFDELYFVGFGFKEERFLDRKLGSENTETRALQRKLKLKIPDSIKQYRKQRLKNTDDKLPG